MVRFEVHTGTTKTGKHHISVMAFRGKARNHYANYAFRNEDHASDWMAQQHASERKTDQQKIQRATDRQAARAHFTNPYHVGDILYNSWGYDQTNIDWYQVVRVSRRSIWVRAIAGTLVETGNMSGTTTPCKGQFTSAQTLLKTLTVYVDGTHTIPAQHGCLTGYHAIRGGISCSWYG